MCGGILLRFVNKRIVAYLRLMRIHTAGLTACAPLAGGLVMGETDVFRLLLLIGVGVLCHIYGFVLNEYFDREIDRQSLYLQGKPLVSGVIPVQHALFLSVGAMLVAVLLTVLFVFSWFTVGCLFLAFLFGFLYDRFAKKLPYSDFVVGIGFFFLCLYGAFSVSSDISGLAYVVALLAMMQMTINNIIAGMKDVDHDFVVSGLSTPLRLGVKLHEKGMAVSKRFIAFLGGLKATHISLTVVPFFVFFALFQVWQLVLIVVLIGIGVVFIVKLLTCEVFDRERIIRIIGFHEMFAFLVIPVLLYGLVGVGAAVFLVLFPFVWLAVFMRVLYGCLTPMI